MKTLTIDAKIRQLLDICDRNTFMFPEYYSHTRCMMWKILNPYTKYKEEKFVLYSVEEGIEKSLDAAIEQISKSKQIFIDQGETI
jgi:hypothetical protein